MGANVKNLLDEKQKRGGHLNPRAYSCFHLDRPYRTIQALQLVKQPICQLRQPEGAYQESKREHHFLA